MNQTAATSTGFYTLATLIGFWQIFKKAGYPGWYAIIPFYNIYILCKITTGCGWLWFFTLIPVLNFLVAIFLMYRLSCSFQHGILFTLGLIVFYPVFILILGFGKSEYEYA